MLQQWLEQVQNLPSGLRYTICYGLFFTILHCLETYRKRHKFFPYGVSYSYGKIVLREE